MEDKREIERRLQALIEISGAPPRCSSTIFKVATVIGFILFCAVAAGSLFVWVKWENSKTETKIVVNDKVQNEKRLAQSKETLKAMRQVLDDTVAQLSKVRTEVADYTKKIDEIKHKTEEMEKSVADMTKALETATKERDQAKIINTNLRSEDQKLTEQVQTMKREIETLNNTAKRDREVLNIWKIGSNAGLLFTAITGLIDINGRVSLINKKEDYRVLEEKSRAFPSLAPVFENYAYWAHSEKFTIRREVCFHNGQKADLQKCVNMSPTLTTITTRNGFVFSILLTIAWRTDLGTYADDKSMVLSANHAKSAIIKDQYSKSAFIVKPSTLMEFGNEGIMILLDGKNGTANAGAYNVPSPYAADNFLETKSASFDVLDIKVERITFE